MRQSVQAVPQVLTRTDDSDDRQTSEMHLKENRSVFICTATEAHTCKSEHYSHDLNAGPLCAARYLPDRSGQSHRR
jgi:hypothetical protein